MIDATILIADDDSAIRTVVSRALTRQGYDVQATGNAATLWQWVSDGQGDMVITDVVMPDEDGLELLPRIKTQRPNLPVVVMSAQNTLLTALKATERGAFDYLPKPFEINELVALVGRAVAQTKQRDRTRDDLGQGEQEILPLVGRSAAMQDIYRLLARLAPTELNVMIYGESGTGKELAARVLHDYGRRSKGPFIAINMAAVPKDLIESELFGHEKGAFTGATARSSGLFEQARGGTLFLDEIGDMPLEAQTRLLRVLQEGEFTTVGGRTPIPVDARIVAATHRDIRAMMRRGDFREDLFFRLDVAAIRLPPLRSRVEDIPELVQHFFDKAVEKGGERRGLERSAMDTLKAHDWPGNVRELENLILRLAALYSEEVIGPEVISAELGQQNESKLPGSSGSPGALRPSGSESLGQAVDRHLETYFEAHDQGLPAAGVYARVIQEVERPLILRALKATKGNQIQAARLLGLNRNTLRKKIRELDIEVLRGIG